MSSGVRGGGGSPPAWKIQGKLCFQVRRKLFKILNHKNMYSMQWIQGTFCFSGQAQVAQNPECEKYIQYSEKCQTGKLFFRANACWSKYWTIVNIYSIQSIQGTLCFSGQVQVAQKSWKTNNISIHWKILGQTLFFRASAIKLLKIPNDKKYMFNTVNSANTLFFRASASCSKILNVKGIFNTVKNLRVFYGKRKVAQKSCECQKM